VGAASPTATGELTDELIETSWWSDELMASAGIPVHDAELVTVGGGLGCFALVDTLRVAGVSPSRMLVLSGLDVPYGTYRYLTHNSQIPDAERLRSDSGSVLDCIWGWPGYAVREAFAARTLSGVVAPLYQVATEPILTDYYTPRSGQVFDSVDRETARIGYQQLLWKGQVRMVRRRTGGGYFSLLTLTGGSEGSRRVAVRSSFVHLALGYPGLKFLPDLQEYRQKYQDYSKVVNAYEPHDHVYEDLIRRPGIVVVRGNGIVASRVLQRLCEDIEHKGAQTQIVHLFRNYVSKSEGPSVFMRRPGSNGFSYQGFNWPKSSWTGQLKVRLDRLEGAERAALLNVMGGTTTPRRKLWRTQLARGAERGYYRQYVGEVTEVMPGDDRTTITRVRSKDGTQLEIPAHFVIDATGLEGSMYENRVLADLLEHGGAGENPIGRLDVDRTFEVRGTRSEPGRLYASGAMTLGGYFATVDSFLGLQYAALQIADDLARVGWAPRIGIVRSVTQWWRWARNRSPEGARVS
jgi:hypothetical protein